MEITVHREWAMATQWLGPCITDWKVVNLNPFTANPTWLPSGHSAIHRL